MGKAFGRRKSGGYREFKNQVSTSMDSRLRTECFVYNSRMTSLNEVSAHQADNATVGIFFPNAVNLLFVTKVHGVIFANYTDDFQNNPTFPEKFCQ